jgi:hypothetical protein
MAARKKVVVGVGPNGEIEVDAVGYPDDSCFAATKAYEEAIGTVVEVKNKPTAGKKAKVTRKVAAGLPAGFCG